MKIYKTFSSEFTIDPSTLVLMESEPAPQKPTWWGLPWWAHLSFLLALGGSGCLFMWNGLAGICAGAAVLAEWGVFVVAWKTPTDRVNYEDAKDALAHMKDWATWLATIATGAIGALGFVFESAPARVKHFAMAAIVMLGSSVFCCGWLLGALPSIRQRLKKVPDPSYQNDIYAGRMFGNNPLKLQACAGSASFLGIIGLVLFALAFVVRLEVKEKESEKMAKLIEVTRAQVKAIEDVAKALK